MQMVRLNIKRHNTTAVQPVGKNEDLDEKIRRIRERNKKRQERFQEIEQDKMLALDPGLMKKDKNGRKKESSKDSIHTDTKTQPCKNVTMKGLQPATKMAKGRAQRLKEMSNNPLKAEHFKSRTKDQMEFLEEPLQAKLRLKNNCRSSIRERIKNKECLPSEQIYVSEADDNFNCISEGQQNNIPKDEILLPENKESSRTTQEPNDTKLLHDIQEETQQNNETNQVLENVEQPKTVTEIKETNTTNQPLGKEPSTQKNKPKITVTLKKTGSSSSFDESMAMLSPLDLPQNWGDLDFSDEELPPISSWKNP